MKSAGRERGKEMRKQTAGGERRQQNAKKMLNKGNELRDLLKTRHLALLGAKDELKTNSVLSPNSMIPRLTTAHKNARSTLECGGLTPPCSFEIHTAQSAKQRRFANQEPSMNLGRKAASSRLAVSRFIPTSEPSSAVPRARSPA